MTQRQTELIVTDRHFKYTTSCWISQAGQQGDDRLRAAAAGLLGSDVEALEETWKRGWPCVRTGVAPIKGPSAQWGGTAPRFLYQAGIIEGTATALHEISESTLYPFAEEAAQGNADTLISWVSSIAAGEAPILQSG